MNDRMNLCVKSWFEMIPIETALRFGKVVGTHDQLLVNLTRTGHERLKSEFAGIEQGS